eukprot:6172585-Pleurochrysis_carterae.AAC.6
MYARARAHACVRRCLCMLASKPVRTCACTRSRVCRRACTYESVYVPACVRTRPRTCTMYTHAHAFVKDCTRARPRPSMLVSSPVRVYRKIVRCAIVLSHSVANGSVMPTELRFMKMDGCAKHATSSARSA